MTRKYDRIIVVDIECTCWEGKPPPGEESDIIEIGICPLDARTGQRLSNRSLIVRPARSTVSPFCTRLTTLTPEQVSRGMSFAEACGILQDEYQSKRRVWASYGDFDRQQFERQCQAMNVPYPFSASHINVKTLFTLIRSLSHDVGMSQAMQMLQIPLEGTHHRGDDDAWNIAYMLSALLLDRRSHHQL